jgi:AraC-like DNA-binding protein
MLAQDYLTLRLVRLKGTEEWSHKREGLSILFPKSGTGTYCSQSPAQRIGAGDVVMMNGASNFRLSASGGVDLVFWCFSVRLDHLYPLFASLEISLLESVADTFAAPKLLPATMPLAKQCHRLVEDTPPQFNLDHRSQLLRVASVILTEEFKVAHERRVGAMGVEGHLVQIFEQLTAEELLTISVGELATRFNCSRRHLNRLFHQYFGFSVAALRMEMRLLKAVSVLRDANAKIINVAEQCGFNHLGLFNTCFKRRFGASPGQWRKLTLHGPAAGGETRAKDNSVCPLHSKGLCPLATGDNSLTSPVTAATSILQSAGKSGGKQALPNSKATRPGTVSPRNTGSRSKAVINPEL